MFKINLGALLVGAMSAFGALAKHDTTGTLSNPEASLTDKANAVLPAMETAGVDVIETALTSKLGPEGAVVAELAVPLLNTVIAAANAKIAALTQAPQYELVHGA